MKSKIFMYLFFFAALFVIFQYMNQKSIFEKQENQINSLTKKLEASNADVAKLANDLEELNYFSLVGNDNAMTYFENLGMEATEVESLVSDYIHDENLQGGGNPLVPFEGTVSSMKINKIKFLNHRWLVADFSDGKDWGDVLVEYFFDEKNQLNLTRLGAVLYPD